MIIVFIAPRRIKKDLGVWGIISDPTNAACPDPRPGRKEENGAAMNEARNDFLKSEKGILIFLRGMMSCLGIFVFCWREVRRAEIPKRPERRGRSGSLTGRLKVKRPRRPERMKTMNAERILFSLRIRYSEMKIRM